MGERVPKPVALQPSSESSLYVPKAGLGRKHVPGRGKSLGQHPGKQPSYRVQGCACSGDTGSDKEDQAVDERAGQSQAAVVSRSSEPQEAPEGPASG